MSIDTEVIRRGAENQLGIGAALHEYRWDGPSLTAPRAQGRVRERGAFYLLRIPVLASCFMNKSDRTRWNVCRWMASTSSFWMRRSASMTAVQPPDTA